MQSDVDDDVRRTVWTGRRGGWRVKVFNGEVECKIRSFERDKGEEQVVEERGR
jgi:hypothetical protein